MLSVAAFAGLKHDVRLVLVGLALATVFPTLFSFASLSHHAFASAAYGTWPERWARRRHPRTPGQALAEKNSRLFWATVLLLLIIEVGTFVALALQL